MKQNVRTLIAVALALVLSLTCFVGCSLIPANGSAGIELASGGVLCLKINPEIAIAYDADGNVTGVSARNEDAKKILESYTGFEGKPAKTVVVELVELIGQAGYFVEEVDGEVRHITIEIEPGSSLPAGTFLDDVIADVRTAVSSNNWQSPLDVQGMTIYGMTNYVDTDYGAGSDGVTNYTDYNEPTSPYTDYDATDYGATQPAPAAATEPAPTTGRYTDYGKTDYNATDYNDPTTPYTDYNEPTSPYTDYSEPTTPYTDYNDPNTDYDDNKTDYDGTDYR